MPQPNATLGGASEGHRSVQLHILDNWHRFIIERPVAISAWAVIDSVVRVSDGAVTIPRPPQDTPCAA
jgi:hypothetical protein